jgi:hypothetical protein
VNDVNGATRWASSWLSRSQRARPLFRRWRRPAAGGLSGAGQVTFPNISRWRRATFSDFTSALRPGKPQAAPTSTQFTPEESGFGFPDSDDNFLTCTARSARLGQRVGTLLPCLEPGETG